MIGFGTEMNIVTIRVHHGHVNTTQHYLNRYGHKMKDFEMEMIMTVQLTMIKPIYIICRLSFDACEARRDTLVNYKSKIIILCEIN